MEIAMNNTDPNRFPLKWFQPRPGLRRTCCRYNFHFWRVFLLMKVCWFNRFGLTSEYIYIYICYIRIYIFQIDLYSQDITSIDNNLDFIESICKVPFWVTSDITIILPETHTQTLSNCQPAKHCSCKYLSNLSGFLRESWMLDHPTFHHIGRWSHPGMLRCQYPMYCGKPSKSQTKFQMKQQIPMDFSSFQLENLQESFTKEPRRQ